MTDPVSHVCHACGAPASNGYFKPGEGKPIHLRAHVWACNRAECQDSARKEAGR